MGYFKDKQILILEAITQIENDIESEDTSGIFKLLENIPDKILEAFVNDDSKSFEKLRNVNNQDNEVKRLEHLIQGNPDDVRLLKKEYYELSGKNYYTKGG